MKRAELGLTSCASAYDDCNCAVLGFYSEHTRAIARAYKMPPPADSCAVRCSARGFVICTCELCAVNAACDVDVMCTLLTVCRRPYAVQVAAAVGGTILCMQIVLYDTCMCACNRLHAALKASKLVLYFMVYGCLCVCLLSSCSRLV